jgi:hypothetical protein
VPGAEFVEAEISGGDEEPAFDIGDLFGVAALVEFYEQFLSHVIRLGSVGQHFQGEVVDAVFMLAKEPSKLSGVHHRPALRLPYGFMSIIKTLEWEKDRRKFIYNKSANYSRAIKSQFPNNIIGVGMAMIKIAR